MNAPGKPCGKAALVRFLAQGVEATSAEQIAADAGVSLRTFYRHFTSKHDLLFADFDAGLQWFRTALAARPAEEPVLSAVTAAIDAFPYDAEAVTKIAGLRADELDSERIVRNIRQVEADFAVAVESHLDRTHRGSPRLITDCTAPSPLAASLRRCSERWSSGWSGMTDL